MPSIDIVLKTSIPSSIRISLPAWGTPKSDLPFVEVVEVQRDPSFDPSPLADINSPAIPSSRKVPYEFPAPSVERIGRSISTGVCRVVYRSQHLVIKFALGRRSRWRSALEREANNYKTHLSTVHGSVVPFMYGYYTGNTCDDRKLPVSCLILEDCGDSLTQAFSELTLEDRVKIMRQYCEVHTLGLAFKDFAERNVVHKDGRYRLIDFHDIEDIKGVHKCGLTGQLLEGTPDPGARKIGCGIIYNTGIEMDLWGYPEGFVRVLNRLMKGDDLPSQEDIDTLCNNVEFALYPPMVGTLHEWLREYKRVKAKVPLEKYATTRPDLSYKAHKV